MQAHLAATGVYMVPQSVEAVSMMALRNSGPVSYLFHSDTFYNVDNSLVLLDRSEPEILDIDALGMAYPSTKVKQFFENSWISALTDNTGKVIMYVLEKQDGTATAAPTTMILLPDGIWYASNGEAGVMKSTEARHMELYEAKTLVQIDETLKGENIKIVFDGRNTHLNDDENITGITGGTVTNPGYANVITNNLVILATDSGNIFESADPMVIKPFSGNTVDIQILSAGGPYSGDAYLRTLLEADVTLHDTEVGKDGTYTGLIDLEIRKGNLDLTDVTVQDECDLIVDIVESGDVLMDNVSVLGNGNANEGELIVTTGEGNLTVVDTVISGIATVRSLKSGKIDVNNTTISGTANITSNGNGDITITNSRLGGDTTISNNKDIDGMDTGKGSGDVTIRDVTGEEGIARVSTGKGNMKLDYVTVKPDSTLELDTGAGNVTLGQNDGTPTDNKILVDGTLDIFSGTGTIDLNRVDVGKEGALLVDTGSLTSDAVTDNINDVTVDAVYVAGKLNITTTKGDLLMEDDDSRLALDKTFNEADSFFDIGGNIGDRALYFKTGYLDGIQKESLTLNIRNVDDMFLTQVTDIATVFPDVDSIGRLEGADEKTEHDETISDMVPESPIEIQIQIMDQTPEELAAQIVSGLDREAIMDLIGGKLMTSVLKDIIELTEKNIRETLSTLTRDQIYEIWNAVVGTEENKPVLEVKETEVDAMKIVLEESGKNVSRMTEEQILAAYEAYYQKKHDAFGREVARAILASMEEDHRLNTDEVSALMFLDQDEAMEAVLVEAIKAQQVKMVDGVPVQAVDENGDKLYLDEKGKLTTKEQDSKGRDNTPVYEMETIMSDESELFKAYWDSLDDVKKQELIEMAYDALAGLYPNPRDDTTEPRDLILNIGESHGESYLVNVGDITIDQETGTFTAGQVVTTHGDVQITSGAIEGVANQQQVEDTFITDLFEEKFVGEKTDDEGNLVYGTEANVYAQNHVYTAETGGIGEKTPLITEQRSWKESTVADIENEEPLPVPYNSSNEGSWDILRNEDGQIEMNFVVYFTAVRDIDLTTATDLLANALGDIAISELTGDQKITEATSTNGSITLKAPEGTQTIGTVQAGQNAYLEAKGDQMVNTVTAGNNATLTTGGNQTVNSVSAGNNAFLSTDGDLLLQHITAGNRADIYAEGNVIDNRIDRTEPNVKASDGSITVETGYIGKDADNRIDVQISGKLTTDSFADTNLNAIGNLNLTADTREGLIHVDGSGDLKIDNTDQYNDGNMNLGAVEAQGDVTISAVGGLILCDKLDRPAQVTGNNINLNAGNGNVGTKEEPILVDTAAGGVLNAQAQNGTVVVTEISDDMTVGTITSTGTESVVILRTEDGSIYESDKGNNDTIRQALEKAKEAAQAQARAEALEDQFQVIDRYMNAMESVKQNLETAVDNQAQAQNELLTAKADQQAAKDVLVAEKAALEALKDSDSADEEAIAQQRERVNEAQQNYNDAVKNTREKEAQLKAANAEIRDVMSEAGEVTFDMVPGLDRAKTPEQMLEALAAEQAAKQPEYQAVEDAMNQARSEAQDLSDEAQSLAEQAESSGISTEGNVILDINSTTGKANLGSSDNALGITSGGTVTVKTGKSTALADVYLESGGDIVLNPIKASGNVEIDSMGSIQGSKGGNKNTVTANRTELNSLNGNIGNSEDDPLRISVKELDAIGKNVWIENDRSVKLDSIIGDNIDLNVDGDITGNDDPEHYDVIGGNVNLNASGDIGGERETVDEDGNTVLEKDPLDVEADEISASGNNIDLKTEGDMLINQIEGRLDVTLEVGGDVTDKGEEDSVIAQNLEIVAGGGIGEEENPLNVHVPGNLILDVLYGDIFAINSYVPSRPVGPMRTLIAEDYGIKVTGIFSKEVKLHVHAGCEHSECDVCAYLASIDPEIVLGQYDLELEGSWYGMLLVEIPVDERYEGQILTVAYCLDGKLMTMDLRVRDGYVRFWTNRLLAYTVLNGRYRLVINSDGSRWLEDDENVPVRTISQASSSSMGNAALEVLKRGSEADVLLQQTKIQNVAMTFWKKPEGITL